MRNSIRAFVVGIFVMGCLGISTASAASVPKGAPARVLAIQLGAPFNDNAILQRDMEVPVWGWSKPGTKITVEFAGQKKKAEAGKDGKWMLKLGKLKASFDPREMVITDNKGKKVTLKNILVGEVWMASGQSNMQWTCTKSSCNRLTAQFKAACEAKGLHAKLKDLRLTQFASSGLVTLLRSCIRLRRLSDPGMMVAISTTAPSLSRSLKDCTENWKFRSRY